MGILSIHPLTVKWRSLTEIPNAILQRAGQELHLELDSTDTQAGKISRSGHVEAQGSEWMEFPGQHLRLLARFVGYGLFLCQLVLNEEFGGETI